ncbi:MAG: hypothetical protein EPO53_33560 [Variovorax sp.]|jgi:hypothetical protein|nr:MAG: hypothetical protein EPO53_33560 [Variovorax sp.]
MPGRCEPRSMISARQKQRSGDAKRRSQEEEDVHRKHVEAQWEIRKIVAGWIAAIAIPIAIAIGGWLINLALKDRDAQTKYIELSVSILSSEPKPFDDYRAMRKWAVDTLEKYSKVPLPALAKSGLENSLQLTGKGLAAEVGVTLTTLDSRRGPGIPIEMSFENLVTDALRSAFSGAPKADFAIITSNSFRGKRIYSPGVKLTREDFLREMPFSNSVVLLSMSGAQLLDAIQEAANQPGAGGIPQVSGLSVKYSEDKSKIKIESLIVGGDLISPEKKYLVATTSFDAAGHVRKFHDAEQVAHTSTGRHIYDVVLLHMYDERSVSPVIEGRIARLKS